jgi:Na+-transporting NADH:ubiquinone oxidoreductase subunit C
MKEKIYTVCYMMVVAGVFTAGVTFIKTHTEEQIRLNEEAKLQRVVLGVLGIVPADRTIEPEEVGELYRKRVTKETVDGLTLYAGYADDGELIGYAFPVAGMGLWSRIEGILAVDEGLETILGIDFTKHGETPGLGARITEAKFKKQFEKKPLTKKEGTDKYIEFVSPDRALGPHDVHSITGATQTSKGVERFLNADIDRIKDIMASHEEER